MLYLHYSITYNESPQHFHCMGINTYIQIDTHVHIKTNYIVAKSIILNGMKLLVNITIKSDK